MAWIFYTLAATIFQTFRNLEQKNLNRKLDELTVSWSRFILPLPLSIAAIFFTYNLVSYKFIFLCITTAIFQVLGNIFLLKTFKSRNFSIGIAFYKTETLQTLLLGLLVFNDKISLAGIICAIITMVGVILMSGSVWNMGFKKFLYSLNNATALYGLLCGFCFSVSAYNLKFATQAFIPGQYSITYAAIAVLLWVIAFQNLLFSIIKLAQNRFISDLKSLFMLENKFSFIKTSLLSFTGSICWFIAYGLGSVVYVKIVGQVELVWAILASHYMLREKTTVIEGWGIFVTAIGIIGVILS